MALATKCPHCATTFRVAADQLKLRGGIVRCGACQHIFDGNANLIDLDAPAAAPQADEQAWADTAAASATQAVPQPASTPAAEPEPDDIPVYEVDLGSALDPLGILPKPQADARGDTGQLAGEPAEGAEEIEVIDMAGQPEPPDQAHIDEPGQAEAETGAAEPPEDQTLAAPEVALDDVTKEAGAVADEEAPAVEETGARSRHGTADGDAATQRAARAEPAAPRASEHKHPFPMGSALLSEPGEPAASHEARVEPTLGLPVDEELVAAPPPADHNEPAEASQAEAETLSRFAGEYTPLPLREAAEAHFSGLAAAPAAAPAKPRSRLGRRSKLTPTRIAPPKLRVPEIDEPDFVKRGRQQEQSGKRRRILMAAGSVVLALVLAAQAAFTLRNDLAARYPGMKPALTAACSLLGCRVELPARIEHLAIETGDLQTFGNNTYMLSTLLHNQAGLAQAWPAIELALTDANDKPLLRRVFTPAEYLPPGVAPAAGFGAHAEQPVKLYFQLDQLKPSGYHIAIFYP